MSCPTYYDFFPSVMNCLSDGKEHSMKEIYEFCANEMNLSEEERRETISSGMPTYMNRASWARTYLSKAGLLEKTGWSVYKLTNSGKEAVKYGTDKIGIKYLEQFEAFKKFKTVKNTGTNATKLQINTIADEQSPQEQIDTALDKLNETLADDLMSEILKMSPYDFESLIVKLLIKMGYGTLKQNKESVTKKSGDEGIDGVVSADKFGFDSVYIQAKMWKTNSTVGRPEIQKFLGALAGQGATKGLFITTAHYSKEALAFAEKHLNQKIVLVDGTLLTKLMIEYNLGVSTVKTYSVKKVDYDFFNDEI